VSGEGTALAIALAERGEPEEAEQLGLFGEAETEAGRAMQAQRRGRGRPPGARNKRTERTVAWLLSKHRDPREVLLEIAEANPFDLAAEYGCTPWEAVQEKRAAANAVLPYVAERRPIAINLDGKVVHLVLEAPKADQAVAEDGTIEIIGEIVPGDGE